MQRGFFLPLDRQMEPTVTFVQAYPHAIPPMRADKAASGVLPTIAFRHCEPVRTASSFGWYIFPPEDVVLRWDGADVLIRQEAGWEPLTQTMLPDMGEYWDRCAPESLQGMAPPFVSMLPVRGYVQIWSGLLCKAAPGWSVSVRSLVNIPSTNHYRCFEGVVEADQFAPFPLFMNIQLLATNVDIAIPKVQPFFQIQPLLRQTYQGHANEYEVRSGLKDEESGVSLLSAEEWAGYRKTVRISQTEGEEILIEGGSYTVGSRKRQRHSEE